MRPVIPFGRSLVGLVSLHLMLASVVWATSPHGASAQTELYRWGSGEPAGFRFAASNERWVALERDRDLTHQELVALDIPSGRELWRTPLASNHVVHNALTVTDTHFAWAVQNGGLRVFDAGTGRLVWSAAMRPHMSGGCVALAPDGGVTALTWDFEVVSWSAAGVELSRLTLAPDWGAHSVVRHGHLAVVLGSRIHVVDVRTGTLVIESAPHEWTSGAFVGNDLVVGSDRGVAALDPLTLEPRWQSPQVGHVSVASSTALAIARENGLLSWLDPRTGADLATIGIGDPYHIHRYRPRASWGVAPGAAGRGDSSRPMGPAQDLLLVRDASGAFLAFAGAPVPAPVASISGVVRINGRGRRGVLVNVGDQRVRTGSGGRFSVPTALPGVIRVSVSAEELRARARLPCALEVSALVDRTSPRVVLDAIALDYECDSACRCD